MTDLLLQPSPARGPNDYEVIADDWIVGRIVLSDASPAEKPWMWSLDVNGPRNLPSFGPAIFPTLAGLVISRLSDR